MNPNAGASAAISESDTSLFVRSFCARLDLDTDRDSGRNFDDDDCEFGFRRALSSGVDVLPDGKGEGDRRLVRGSQ